MVNTSRINLSLHDPKFCGMNHFNSEGSALASVTLCFEGDGVSIPLIFRDTELAEKLAAVFKDHAEELKLRRKITIHTNDGSHGLTAEQYAAMDMPEVDQ